MNQADPLSPYRHDHRQLPLKRVKLAVLGALALAGAIVIQSNAADSPAEGPGAANSQGQQPPEQRFDNLVRTSFFSGYAGDQAALARGMKMCEDELAKNPKNAEALVWHGGGSLFIAGQAFQKGDFQHGIEIWTRGLKEMDDAVALRPEGIEVLIPRGATLIVSSKYVPEADEAKALLKKGVGDFEKVLKIQQPYFSTLSEHSRGELLFGLAEGWSRLGDQDKAKPYFKRLADECKGTARGKQAQDYLQSGALPKNTNCVGCHA